MRPLLMVLGAVGVVSVATATTVAVRSQPEAFQAREAGRPGPDSARVATLLRSLGEADPVFCEMLADQIGNFWWSDGELGVGRFSDARRDARAAKDSVSGAVRDPAALRLLAATLATENSCVRRAASKMLGNSVVADDVLVRLLADGGVRVREAALRAVGERERPGLRARTEQLLAAPEPSIAAMAAWVLGEWESKASVGPLRRALTHDSSPVRTAAAWALGQIEDRASAGALVRLVDSDPSRTVKLAAIEAIGQLDGVGEAPDALVRATESADAAVRYAALEALTHFEDERLAPVMLRFITDPDPDVRVRVIEALGSMRAASAVPALTRALEDRHPEVRRAAIEALAEIDER